MNFLFQKEQKQEAQESFEYSQHPFQADSSLMLPKG